MKAGRKNEAEQVEHVKDEHCAHVVEEVLRLKAHSLKVAVNRISRLDLELFVNYVSEVVKVKCSYLHDLFEEHACVTGHGYLKERHHHDKLLSVDHGPQLVERGRDGDVDHKVGRQGNLRALRRSCQGFLYCFFSAS